MKAAVITFPGSNCDRDLAVALTQAGADVARVWHKDTALPQGVDLVAVPGGFSFGDYLRCGAIAARSPEPAKRCDRPQSFSASGAGRRRAPMSASTSIAAARRAPGVMAAPAES
mgnify:CR=1 FL=1